MKAKTKRVWAAVACAAALAAAAALWLSSPGATAGTPAAGSDPEPPRVAPSPEAAVPVSARAAPGAAVPLLTGTVLGPEGRPEAGVRVVLGRVVSPWPDLRTQPLETALTGPGGEFSFRTPRGHDLLVVAEKAGLASAEVEASPLDPDLTLRMEHGYRIEGYVQDPTGRPIGDCAVLLEPVAFSTHRAVATRTDRKGRFTFEDVAVGGARLTARSPEFQPATTAALAAGAQKVYVLRFSQPSLRLHGSVAVSGTEGQPVAGAVVRALPSSWNSGLFLPIVARTDEGGRFELRGLAPGNLRVEVRHGRFSTKARLAVVSTGNPELSFELVPRRSVGGRLVGHVIAAGTEIELAQPGEPPARARVDADGCFEFDGRLSCGSADLTLPGGEACFAESGSRTVRVQLEEDAKPLELEVAPTSLVHGLVRDEAGRPLAGVKVLWVRAGDAFTTSPPVVAVTDGDGRYEVRGLPRSGWGPGALSFARFVFRRAGYALYQAEVSGASPGEVSELEPVTLVRPGSISGRVRRHGAGVAGAVVIAGYGMGGMLREITGPDGGFTLRELPPGEYRVRASYATMPLVASASPVVVAAGAQAGPVEIELPAGRTIFGEVVAPNGSPIDNALIVVRGERGMALYGGADGKFTIEVAEQTVELQVFANAEMNVHEVVRVPPGQNEVRIEMPLVPWGTVVAKLLGLPGRRPVPGGILRVRSLDGATGDPVRDRQRNIAAVWVETSGGELRLPRFPAGRSELELHCQGWAPHVQTVDVPPDGEVDLGVLLLRPGARVRGRVVDGAGAAIAGARVHLGEELDLTHVPRAGGVFTDAHGWFELRGVGPRSGELVVAAEGYATLTRELRVPQDLLREEPLPIALDVGSTIAVQAPADARRAPGIVILKKDGQVIDYARTDEQGRVRFEHRGPGVYDVELLGASGGGRRVEVAGEQRRYDVELEPARGAQ